MNEVALFVSNPATRSLLHIPTPEQVRQNVNADLKIVFEFLSSEEGVWKSNERRFFTGPRDLRFDMPVWFNEAIHLISTCSPHEDKSMPYIVSYNYENGKSTILSVPKKARRGLHHDSCDMGIFKWGKVTNSTESICLVRLLKSAFTVWVLTDYKSSSWRRIMKARVKALVRSREQNPIVSGYSVLNDECLVFTTENKVYGYNWTRKETVEIGEHKCESSKISIIPYSNTLRPCGILSLPSYYVDVVSPYGESSPSSSKVLPGSK
ncbi:unnamed protein product [Lupinus luteus]|uniref:F-box associated domain-containing protein n=1 Tax=Lupinus luteus TaxID=3873 RepID=A0AAV1XTI5_LUPLU